MQDLIGPNLNTIINSITEPEPSSSKLIEVDKGHISSKANTSTTTTATSLRSNVVSVICTPVPSAKSIEVDSENLTAKSADLPQEIIESIAETSAIENISNKPNSKHDNTKNPTENLPHMNKSKPLTPITLLVALPKQDTCSVPNQTDNNSLSLNNFNNNSNEIFITPEKAISSLIKIVPKIDKPIAINPNTENLLHFSSLISSSKKKEKSEEELLNKLKATEAALPPKAKPGRKSRSATEEDAKDKKKRSLERNRAAAMRCRLKKKREVDDLKSKVKKYEEQNKDLKVIMLTVLLVWILLYIFYKFLISNSISYIFITEDNREFI